MPRLFTPEIARFYEDYYTKKGIQFRKGNVLSSFECDDSGKVPLPLMNTGTMFFLIMVIMLCYILYCRLFCDHVFMYIYLSNFLVHASVL